ncbi:S locus glycop domain-containing protein/B lectin [Salix suchowensis]|nr:S locus glycop domain-containing protein/B lectin [Salix suchowensis]
MDYLSFLRLCFSLLLFVRVTTPLDTMNTTQSIRDGDTLVSASGTYELGFFSPGKSKNRYLGVWYGKISVLTAVWVANRETPLNDSSGVARLTNQGLLVLLNHSGSIIWSSKTLRLAKNPVVQLLDSGNLVVKEKGDNNLENSLWQSFEHPGNTIIPGMKVGWNKITRMEWNMTSWKSPEDPSRGNITGILVPDGYPELIELEDSKVKFRVGPWNGLQFSGVPNIKPNPVYTFEFVFNDNEIFYREHLKNSSRHWRIFLTPNGDIMHLLWMEQTQSWFLYEAANTDICESYALCGANGICSINNSPVCNCLNGFVPQIPSDWNKTDWSGGCVRKVALNCSGDKFRKLSGVKIPETRKSWFNRSMNQEECKNTCLKNCSCSAYTNLDIRDGGSGCLLWFNDLIDIRTFFQNEQDIFIRMAASELAKKRILVSTVLSSGILFIGICLVFYVWKKKQQKNSNLQGRSNNKELKKELELPFFNMDELACATNEFSESNKLGEGGFGPVYKGTLTDGREIAVKRLSKNSRQGLDEFKNEVQHIVKLQHRNLVRLLGCCIERDETMLVYEFLPNRSLDFYVFDETRRLLLDWPKRYNIINGIARGLLYLHQDSRLRIIHRDLKTSNILLDYEMNPKISDFGLARSFGENETEANTNKVAGTYGYISPEYANHGLYSLKSDVFSFGVLVLEIVSGHRNRGFCHPDHHLNLIGHAWILFRQGRALELAEKSKVETHYLSEVLRSIHVGLLCVQENPENRPNMPYVVLMLGNEDALPQPKQPGFFTERDLVEASSSSSQGKPPSANECSSSVELFERIIRVPMDYISFLRLCFSLLLFVRVTTPLDTMNTTQSIRDGDTLVSASGTYELGFFSPGKSKNRYLGVWYGKISVLTAVWVANRETPLNDSSGVARLTNQGLLVLLNHSGSIIWSSNTLRLAKNPVVQLLDSGNLVVKEKGDNNLENSLWQSFEHPGNTLIPGMKLGRNRITGMEWNVTSWKSPDDPARGNIAGILVPDGYPEIIELEDSKVKYRTGPWNGLQFSGVPQVKPNPVYTFEFVFNEEEIFYREQLKNSSRYWRIVLTQNGDFMHLLWIEQTQSWFLYETANTDICESYALCCANGICSINNSPVCNCLNGFVPRVPSDWDKTDWSGGCVRKVALNCSGDKFRKLSGVKMPETRKSWFNRSMNQEECKNTCLKNCSCSAYTNLDIRDGGSGCLLWFNDLIDIRTIFQNEQDIFIRMAASELGNLQGRSNNKELKKELGLPFFNMDELASATNEFSVSNKLGEGGFGPVYKGTLADGREIAVKRLSKNSRQGLDEFKNEVKHIVKLQHRNLVRLLGCCIERDETMLVYEFLPNRSLDFYVFDETQSLLLDWPKRYNIINGIARGLLYLHQDSRLRIIHRDLKTSNILLDYEMNPKISDFGLARSFGENETEANTNKVAGTYGYISPEYANHGLYSLKSDVFSFGVLVLEIVSGHRNRGFCHPDHQLNLIGHAWILFRQGRALELAEKSKVEIHYLSEVLRSIHVGLLCVQEHPENRPNMSYVVLMLGNEDELPQPKQPGFFTGRDLVEASSSSTSANECSSSVLEAR